MSQIKRSRTRRSDDTMDEDSDEKNSKRKSRNLSEKKRRDQFNLLVNELSSMVSTGGRKMDKSTVLKSTIAFLKNHNEIAVRSKVHEIQEDWKPSFLTNEEFTHLVLEAVDGFVMVFSNAGQIFYASESITSLLGHLPNEVLSMTIYEMACEEEQNTLYNTLLSMVEEESQVSFACHMRRGGTSGSKESGYFELVHFFGYFRSNADVIEGDNRYSGYSGEADTRLVFVGTGRLHTPQLIKEMSLIDSSKSEFTSRHSLEWKFLFLDHRAPPIIGYLPFELLGTSGYDYYHIDDLEKVTSCHEALMQKGEGTSCYYRFLTKGQQWIWLQTRFYITYHQWNSKPEFVVCTHRVVSYTDVKKQKTQRGETCPDRMSPTSSNSTTTVTWQNVANKGKFGQRAGSDCTSMSADSPASKHSATTLHSTRSRASQGKLTSNQPPQQQHQHQSFLEPPPQYMAAIPLQPVITGFSSPAAVLSPLPAAEMTPQQSQIHDDLQRKHAKLQAAIDQQQAELRVVSEQLLMAKLGMLQQHHPQPPVSSPYVYSCGNVSSTSAVPGGVMPVSPAISVIGQPADSGILQIQPLVNAPSTLNVHAKSHPSNAPHYPMPDSNTPPK